MSNLIQEAVEILEITGRSGGKGISQKQHEKNMKSWNDRVHAEHHELREKIMAARPHWDRAKLEAIHKSRGQPGDPGLHDIHQAIKHHDELESKFK